MLTCLSFTPWKIRHVNLHVHETGAILQVPLMEKSGRRPLLLGGMIVMVISAGLITVALILQSSVHWLAYVSIICIITFVIGFALGLGEY